MNTENENTEGTTEERNQEQTSTENAAKDDKKKDPATSTEEGNGDIKPLGDQNKTNLSRG